MEKIRIGQMAKMNGVSEQTLRLYDRIGLLRPSYIDPQTNYRYYDISQCSLLDIVNYMKSLGIHLEDIKNQLEQADIHFIINLLRERLDWLDSESARIEKQKIYVRNAIENYNRYVNYPPTGTIVLQHQTDRWFFSVKTDMEIYGENTSCDDYEMHYNFAIRLLRTKMEELGFPLQYTCNSGTIDRAFGRTSQKLSSREVFSFLDDSFADFPNVEKYPAGNFLMIYCNDFAQEYDYANRLLREAMAKGYTVCGDYICEELVMLPIMNNVSRDMFFRLSLPVQISK